MTATEHYRRLERMYLSAPINRLYAPRIGISEGRATIETPVSSDFFHAAGALHGSVYFKVLDDAAFFAVSSLVEQFFVLTVSFNIYFLRPVSKGRLHADGRVISSSRNHFVATSVVTVDGDEVGRGSGTFLRSRLKLSETLGYE